MTDNPAATPDRRPGGRTARVRAQVLDAVRAELAERGHEGLTMEGVATRAGVHRTTVYRRWHDVGGLLADVIDAAGETDWQPPDTGSLHGDLTALNEEIQESLLVRPSFAVALVAASFHSEQAARAQTRLWADRYAQCEILVARAVARAELPPTDARALLITATAPLYHHLVLLRSAPDPHLPERSAATTVAAARAGAFSL
ncbi:MULTISPECIES: TetR/AcrR family transcriptional regulator [unclassified Streptomyces]|uniref:TetR/AcrR family transcriptional regulator n=1 Tax=unclassified Streptomyces TaxID=2593676 RepID=UPI000DBA8811|nr:MULTISPECIES: TetR/AcrR family transcriptional regulator [unclassified Streptomyces]MYT69926.1 TetR family transcriptional regulator [Streptomyces sp. SID8367]RAJ88499.1 TetR family transcriptional regulator [Streptomyces sp. PsTaAH-137]